MFVVGGDEHVWRHTRHGDTYVTVIIDLTPLRDGTGPARLTLGRTLKKRADDVLACFDRPGTGNGPTEAIDGRLEHLRGPALGFRDNHIAGGLLEARGFRRRLHPQP